VWLLLTSAVLAAYFYRAWQRVPLVSNKTTYVAWLSFEVACVLAAVCGLVWLFVPSYVTSPRQARELVLRQNLAAMRAVISQYTLDRHKPPLFAKRPCRRRLRQGSAYWPYDPAKGHMGCDLFKWSVATRDSGHREWLWQHQQQGPLWLV